MLVRTGIKWHPLMWLAIAGGALLLVYEFIAIWTPAPTLSAIVWAAIDAGVVWGVLVGLAFGILIGHLFFPRRIKQ